MDEFSILADEPDFGNISMCPGGIVHVNLAHVSLKMNSSDFKRFADLIGRANQKLSDQSNRPVGSPRLHVVPPNAETPPDTDSQG